MTRKIPSFEGGTNDQRLGILRLGDVRPRLMDVGSVAKTLTSAPVPSAETAVKDQQELSSASSHSPDRSPGQTPFALRIAMISLMFGMFMQALDSTIANVALPYMQGSLQASRDQVTWVLTSYIIASAIVTAPIGWLSARFGRREILLVSLVGFTASSMLCGVAFTLDQMIAFRLLQGVFGASLSPLSQAIILDRYPVERRGTIMATWSMIVMLGPILGPLIGGYLTDQYSWRWVFYVNVPFGILSTLGVFFFLHEKAAKAPPRFDWLGFCFLAIALGSLQLFLDRGPDKGWFDSSEIMLEALIAGLCFYLFIVQLWTSEHSFFDRRMLHDRNFVSGLILVFVVGQLLLATTALLPPYLQTLGGYSVLDSGLLLTPRGIGTMVTMLLAGRLVTKVDTRALMFPGALMLIWTMWEMKSWTPSISGTTLSLVTFIQGVGMGLVFFPLNISTFATLPARYRVEASSLLNLTRNIGSAIGVSTTTAVLTMSSQVEYAQLAAHASPFNRALTGSFLNPATPIGAAMLGRVIAQQASVVGYSNTFMFMFYCSIPAVLFILGIRKSDSPAKSEVAVESP